MVKRGEMHTNNYLRGQDGHTDKSEDKDRLVAA